MWCAEWAASSEVAVSQMKDSADGNEYANSSKNITVDDVQRTASIPADASAPLCCSTRPSLLCSREIYRAWRQPNLRERS